MAVIKAKPEKLISTALAIMEKRTVTPFLTTRLPDDTFVGAKNDTVTLRIGKLRAVARNYEWRTRTAPIVMDDIQGEGGIAFKLDTHVYSATGLTLEHLTLDEINLVREVVGPQAEAVAADLEAKVLAKFATIPWKRTMAITATTDPHLAAIEARRLLDADKVAPRAGRAYLIGSNVEAAWLASDRLSKFDSTGQEGTPALREAIIGRLAGAPVISMMELDPNFIWYGHTSALALANVAPVVPGGAKTGARGVSRNGFAGTVIQDYDSNYARDRMMFHAFAGLTDIRDERAANGDLLDPDGSDYATAKNVRGVGITFDPGADGGSVLS
jgi:P22 coat protein - gene protein 5